MPHFLLIIGSQSVDTEKTFVFWFKNVCRQGHWCEHWPCLHLDVECFTHKATRVLVYQIFDLYLCQMGMEKVLSELSGGLQNMGVEPLPGKNVSAKSPNPAREQMCSAEGEHLENRFMHALQIVPAEHYRIRQSVCSHQVFESYD
jgi:hypothetical protein